MSEHGTASRQVLVLPAAMVGDEDAINIADVGAVLWSGRWWIVALAILAGLVFAVRAWLAAPIYRADVLVAVVRQSNEGGSLPVGDLGSLASLVGVQFGTAEDRRAEYLAMLSSRFIATEFIREQDLMPVLFASRWDAETGTWRASRPPPTVGDAVRRLREDIIQVVDDRDTGLITVAVDLPSRQLAAELANRLVEMVNEKVRSATAAEAQQAIEYLNRELEKTTAIGVRQAIYGLLETNLNRIMMANVQEQYALRVIDAAVTPDANRYIRPRFALETTLGAGGGALLMMAVVLWRKRTEWLPTHRQRQA